MKLNNDNQQKKQQMQDLTEVFLTLKKQYKNIYIHQIEDQIFIYRPLGRAEFKQLVRDDNFSDLEKEEIVCQACVLWPEDYDYENCEAGIPTTLAAAIIKNSFLGDLQSQVNIIKYHRQEMFDFDNQITCIINEAFPQYDIEEIEQWDLIKTAKYLSRAEWKLQNLRGLNMEAYYDPIEKAAEQMIQKQQSEENQQDNQVYTEEIEDESPIKQGKIETIEERMARLNKKGGVKKKLTPEELEELRRKYPEMKWGNNVLEETTIESFKDSVDVTSPALRPGW